MDDAVVPPGLMPMADHLGIAVTSADASRCVATLAWAPSLCTAGGVMHGGALMTLADTAGAVVAFLGLAAGETTATITSTTQMFRPVVSGVVTAEAEIVHRGRTTATVQTRMYDESRRLVAQTTQVQAIRAPSP